MTELVSAFLPENKALHWSRRQSHRFEKWMEEQGYSSLLQIETMTARRWLFYFIAQQLWLRYRRKNYWMFWRKRQQKDSFIKKLEEELTSVIVKQQLKHLIYRPHATQY